MACATVGGKWPRQHFPTPESGSSDDEDVDESDGENAEMQRCFDLLHEDAQECAQGWHISNITQTNTIMTVFTKTVVDKTVVWDAPLYIALPPEWGLEDQRVDSRNHKNDKP